MCLKEVTHGLMTLFAAGSAASALGRPPIFSATLMGAALLIKKGAMNVFGKHVSDGAGLKLFENTIDLTLPYGYYRICDAFEKVLEKHNLDFCLPGILATYFFTQKIENLFRAILYPSSDVTPPRRAEISSWRADIGYIATAAISGAIIGYNNWRRNPVTYMFLMAGMAMIERGCLNTFSALREDQRFRKVFENALYSIIPLSYIFYDTEIFSYLSPPFDTVNGRRFVMAHTLATVSWNCIEFLKSHLKQ